MAQALDESHCLITVEGNENNEETTIKTTKKNDLLTIFVIGRTGVGKSTLINTLLGKRVATVSDDIFPCAQETMKECRGNFCGTETLFYDTKGLADPEEDDEKLLKTLYDAIAMCNTQYIVFICLPLISKVDRSVYNLAKLLVCKFGVSGLTASSCSHKLISFLLKTMKRTVMMMTLTGNLK